MVTPRDIAGERKKKKKKDAAVYQLVSIVLIDGTVGLCRLVGEVNEICQSIDALKNQLNQAENSLKDLQDNRMALEKEISVKKNSIFIDRDKCMTVRTRYPSTIKLQGYQ